MAKRRNFKAIVTDGRRTIGEKNTFAWNSAVRATEAILREHARSLGTYCHGDMPRVVNDPDGERVYRRTWTVGADGSKLEAFVREVNRLT